MMAVAERVRKEARAKKGGGVLTGTNDSTADKVAAIASEGEGGRGRGAGEASTSGKGGADLRSRLDERDGTDAKEKVALDPERMSKAERLAAGLTRRKLKAKEFRKVTALSRPPRWRNVSTAFLLSARCVLAEEEGEGEGEEGGDSGRGSAG